LILVSRRTWAPESGHAAVLVINVTTPSLTARSFNAGSRRRTGSDVTAARTLASVIQSARGRVCRCRTARRKNSVQRITSLRLTHAAEATAAIHIGRIRRLTIRGIMRRLLGVRRCTSAAVSLYPGRYGLKLVPAGRQADPGPPS